MKKVYRRSLYVFFPFVTVPVNTTVVVSKQVWGPTYYLTKQALRPPVYVSKTVYRRFSSIDGLTGNLREEMSNVSGLELVPDEIKVEEPVAIEEPKAEPEETKTPKNANKPKHIKGGERRGKESTRKLSIDFENFHSIQDKLKFLKTAAFSYIRPISIDTDIAKEAVEDKKETIYIAQETINNTKETLSNLKELEAKKNNLVRETAIKSAPADFTDPNSIDENVETEAMKNLEEITADPRELGVGIEKLAPETIKEPGLAEKTLKEEKTLKREIAGHPKQIEIIAGSVKKTSSGEFTNSDATKLEKTTAPIYSIETPAITPTEADKNSDFKFSFPTCASLQYLSQQEIRTFSASQVISQH